MRSHLTSQPFSEHLRQADLSMAMLALRMVTARVLVVLSVLFTSQIEVLLRCLSVYIRNTSLADSIFELPRLLLCWSAQRKTTVLANL